MTGTKHITERLVAIEEELRDLAYESLREVARSPDSDEAAVGRQAGEAIAAGPPGDRQGDRRAGAREHRRLSIAPWTVRRYKALVYDSARWEGFEFRPGRHRHQHPGQVRHHVDADDLRAPRVPDADVRHVARPDLAVARHADPGPRVGRRRPRGADAPPLHQDPHAARRTPVRSRRHLHLRRPRPARRVPLVGQPHGEHGHLRDDRRARGGGRSRRRHGDARAGSAAARRDRDRTVLDLGRRRHAARSTP